MAAEQARALELEALALGQARQALEEV